MKESQFRVFRTPDTARQFIPDFDLPQREAPFLAILFPDGHVSVFPREQAVAMSWYIVRALNEIVRDGDIAHQEASL
jgi:hypothetical protein